LPYCLYGPTYNRFTYGDILPDYIEGGGDLSIEIRHLRYVIAAAEHGSFRRAAQVIGVQESAISRRIRDLEARIGATLFLRHHGGVELTLAGRRFVQRAKKVVSQIGQAALDAKCIGRGEEGVVRIGILSSLASGFLAELLRAYDTRYPGVRLDLVEGGANDHLGAVGQHGLDLAFLTGVAAPKGCCVTPLWTERIFVALSRSHHLSQRDAIGWDDLREQHFIVTEAEPGPETHNYLVRHLAKGGARLSVERCAVYRDNLLQLVAFGRGLTLVSEAASAASIPGVVFRPMQADPVPFAAVWSAKNDNPALRRLLNLARTLADGWVSQAAMTMGSEFVQSRTLPTTMIPTTSQ